MRQELDAALFRAALFSGLRSLRMSFPRVRQGLDAALFRATRFSSPRSPRRSFPRARQGLDAALFRAALLSGLRSPRRSVPFLVWRREAAATSANRGLPTLPLRRCGCTSCLGDLFVKSPGLGRLGGLTPWSGLRGPVREGALSGSPGPPVPGLRAGGRGRRAGPRTPLFRRPLSPWGFCLLTKRQPASGGTCFWGSSLVSVMRHGWEAVLWAALFFETVGSAGGRSWDWRAG